MPSLKSSSQANDDPYHLPRLLLLWPRHAGVLRRHPGGWCVSGCCFGTQQTAAAAAAQQLQPQRRAMLHLGVWRSAGSDTREAQLARDVPGSVCLRAPVPEYQSVCTHAPLMHQAEHGPLVRIRLLVHQYWVPLLQNVDNEVNEDDPTVAYHNPLSGPIRRNSHSSSYSWCGEWPGACVDKGRTL